MQGMHLILSEITTRTHPAPFFPLGFTAVKIDSFPIMTLKVPLTGKMVTEWELY